MHPSKENPLAELTRQFKLNAKIITSDQAESLTLAGEYWLRFQLHYYRIMLTERTTAQNKCAAKHALDAVHSEAVRYLMRLATRYHLNGGALGVAGRMCRELYEIPVPGQPAKVRINGATQPSCILAPASDTFFCGQVRTGPGGWPACLGDDLYQFPHAQQSAILAADEIFLSLSAAYKIAGNGLAPDVGAQRKGIGASDRFEELREFAGTKLQTAAQRRKLLPDYR